VSAYKKKTNFFETEEGVAFVEVLKRMTTDEAYNTGPSFSANTELYPDHLIPFVNKHVNYLRNHPSTDPQHYLSNLRLMTRVGGSGAARS
jgi:hypothetical protein